MITYRSMTVNDIPAGLNLCRTAGWNQVSRDWELFLKSGPEDCRVATDENDHVVGTVTTIDYENHFSWIGMVLVDPLQKRKGIGTQLLKEALEIVPEGQTIKLDATPEGREVYLKLNFVDEYKLSRLHTKTADFSKLPVTTARPMKETDFDVLLKSDQKVFGAERREVLKWMWNDAPEYAFVVEDKHEISGYCFGRNGHHYVHIGPVVAQDINDAKQLVAAALRHCKNKQVILDVNQDAHWLDWLYSIGFAEQRQLIRMYRGKNLWPGRPRKQYAILGPEFG